jgi:hypothetical protein
MANGGSGIVLVKQDVTASNCVELISLSNEGTNVVTGARSEKCSRTHERRAVAAGASQVVAIEDAYGWRLGRIVDPFGQRRQPRLAYPLHQTGCDWRRQLRRRRLAYPMHRIDCDSYWRC